MNVSLSNTGSAAGNSGVVFAGDIIIGPGTNNFSRTSVSSVVMGANPNTTQSFDLTFSQPVSNPYLFFSSFDSGEIYGFSQPFTLAQGVNASVSGQSVLTTGSNTQDDGFVVGFSGTYSTLNFTYNNPTSIYRSTAFTTGVPVPGPFPALGAGLAFGFSRQLRARIRAHSYSGRP